MHPGVRDVDEHYISADSLGLDKHIEMVPAEYLLKLSQVGNCTTLVMRADKG